jgi:hypothetical protein
MSGASFQIFGSEKYANLLTLATIAQYLCNISQCMHLYKCAVDHYVPYIILAFSFQSKYSLEGVVSVVLSIIKRPHFLYLEQGVQLLG